MTVSFQTGCYGVRLAQGPQDLAACQALRHRCFFGADGCDADGHDADYLHIMVGDAHGLVGTCRVKIYTGATLDRSYAAARYDLRNLAAFPDPLMEIGRFCIAPQAREADVLRLVWGALTQLVDMEGVGLLFGCTSFQGVDPAPYAAAFGVLASRALAPRHLAPGVAAPTVIPLQGPAHPDGLRQMPSLLRSYLGLGGWVSDHAVIDHEMNTLHVFTGLEVAAIPPRRAAAMRAIAAGASVPS